VWILGFEKASQSCLLTQKTNGQNQICYVNFPTKFISEKHKKYEKKMDKLKIRKNKFVGEKQDRNNNFLIILGNLNNFYAK
jgi:hypothetical protein